MNMNFKDLSLEQIIELIESKKTTKEEVFDYFQSRIDKYDKDIKSYNFINKNGLNSQKGKLA
jgi:Asp-tRNA(Asn)/Glu-tRNA(Gln) amidotransferase A subunit family amidase